jgi:hypothetical protein
MAYQMDTAKSWSQTPTFDIDEEERKYQFTESKHNVVRIWSNLTPEMRELISRYHKPPEDIGEIGPGNPLWDYYYKQELSKLGLK